MPAMITPPVTVTLPRESLRCRTPLAQLLAPLLRAGYRIADTGRGPLQLRRVVPA